MLKVSNVSSGYGKLQVISCVSLLVNAGEFVTVLGPNGAGKTTLLETLVGLIRPMSGHVKYASRDITGLSSHHVIRRGIVLVPQGRLIFSPLTVERNLELGGLAARYPLNHPVARRQLDLLYTLFPWLKERLGTTIVIAPKRFAVSTVLSSDVESMIIISSGFTSCAERLERRGPICAPAFSVGIMSEILMG